MKTASTVFGIIILLMQPASPAVPDDLSEMARFPEVVDLGKRNHIDYPSVATRADRGDGKSLHTLFGLTQEADGAAAEVHSKVLHLVLKNLGDSRFSSALRLESADLRDRVLELIDYDIGHPWKKDFPRTYSLGSHNAKLIHGGK